MHDKTWSGRIHTMGMDGPYIVWKGKPARLCPWSN